MSFLFADLVHLTCSAKADAATDLKPAANTLFDMCPQQTGNMMFDLKCGHSFQMYNKKYYFGQFLCIQKKTTVCNKYFTCVWLVYVTGVGPMMDLYTCETN